MEITEHLLAARVQIKQDNARLFAALIGHEGHAIRRRMKARREGGFAPIGQEGIILAILIHDGEAPQPAVTRAGFRDIDNASIEIAFLAQQSFIDHVRNQMRDAPPITSGRSEGRALQLVFRQHVPQAEFHAKITALHISAPRCQRLRANHAPILKARCLRGGFRCLNEGLAFHRAKQAGIAQIGLHHARDIAPETLAITRPREIRNGDRDRVCSRARDVNHRPLRKGRIRCPRKRRDRHRTRGTKQKGASSCHAHHPEFSAPARVD